MTSLRRTLGVLLLLWCRQVRIGHGLFQVEMEGGPLGTHLERNPPGGHEATETTPKTETSRYEGGAMHVGHAWPHHLNGGAGQVNPRFGHARESATDYK